MSRSKFEIQLTCNPNEINNIIQNFLITNSFTLNNDNGEQYYVSGNEMMLDGIRYFKYNLFNNSLTIYAWINRGFGEGKIENLNMDTVPYLNSLNSLFQEIGIINSGNTISIENKSQSQSDNFNNTVFQNSNMGNTNYQQNISNMYNMQNPYGNQAYQPNNQNDYTQNFQNEASKKHETLCEIGFWLSLVGLVVSLFGIAFGILVYAFDFYFASQGLKTRKRGKAIATIVLSIISIVIVIVHILFAVTSTKFY